LELFSLERKGRPVAGRPFRPFGRFATNRLRFFIDVERKLLLMRAARRVIGLAAFSFLAKFVASLHNRYRFLVLISGVFAPDESPLGGHGLRGSGVVDKICRFAANAPHRYTFLLLKAEFLLVIASRSARGRPHDISCRQNLSLCSRLLASCCLENQTTASPIRSNNSISIPDLKHPRAFAVCVAQPTCRAKVAAIRRWFAKKSQCN